MAQYLLNLLVINGTTAMNRIPIFWIFLLIPMIFWAQGDLPTTKPIEIGSRNNLDALPSSQGTVLRIPSVLDNDLISKDNPIKMLPERRLLQAGHDLKIDPKVREGKRTSQNEITDNIYFGDFKTKIKTAEISFRDHGQIDGDRIEILLNGIILNPNMLLDGNYKKLVISLNEGFNTVEFRALNQGYLGQNTAQFIIKDLNGNILFKNEWWLSTNKVASFIIVREAE